jgi:signal transduction histidine kinase
LHGLALMPRSRLVTKYFTLIVVLVSGALLVSSAIGLYFSYQESERALTALQREKAIAAAYRIEQYIRSIEHEIDWSTLPSPLENVYLIEQRRFEYLKLLRQSPAITDVYWLDAAGREKVRVSRVSLDRVEPDRTLEADPRYTVAMAGRTYFGPVYFRNESEPYMAIARRAGGDDGGVTVAEVNLKFVWDVVSQIKIGSTGVAYVVDADGHLIAHPDISLVLQKLNWSDTAQVRLARQSTGGAEDERPLATVATNREGQKVLTSSAPISTLGWSVITELQRGEAFAPLVAELYRALVLLLLGLALSTMASVFLARRMVQPIRAIQQGAAQLAGGDLDQRISVRSGDELEALADQFNKMAAALKDSYSGLEHKVEERTRELEIANRHKSEFLANMSHELRTPLNAIIGFSAMLRERLLGGLSDKQAEFIGDIHASGKHLLSLIDDILDLSKVEAGRMELNLSKVHVASAIDNALTLVRERATRHGIALSANVDDNIGEITVDERKLKQILLNLLSNAVKFTPEGGRIDVSARNLESRVEISVADTGIGIAPEDQAAVFEEFRQVGSDYTKKAEGTGLGLTLTRKFVELHGGMISLTSEPRSGSIFTFTLPRDQQDKT